MCASSSVVWRKAANNITHYLTSKNPAVCNDARGCLSLKHTFHALNLSVWTVRKRAHVPQSFDVENLKFLGHGQITEISNTVIEE